MEGDISTLHLNNFITSCQGLSKISLLHEIHCGRLDLNHSLINKNQIDEFAMDCIADLFAADNHGQLHLLQRFFEPHMEQLETTPKLIIPLLRKLITSRVRQSLISHFSKVDKGGWKIWRNLSLAPRRHAHIHEFTYLNSHFYYYSENKPVVDPPSNLNPAAEAIPEVLLDEWLRSSVREQSGMPQVLAHLLKQLQSNDDYQHFICKGQLYSILKGQLNVAYSDIEDMENIFTQDTQIEFPRTTSEQMLPVEDIMVYLENQIADKYTNKGKIDTGVSLEYMNILKLYFSDLLADGYAEKLPTYVDLTKSNSISNNQWLQHRGHLEYLIKMGKSWMKAYLKDSGFLNVTKMGLNK